MIKRIEGEGLTDLTCALESLNLSQRGSADPKRIRVSYEYESVSGAFSIACDEIVDERKAVGA